MLRITRITGAHSNQTVKLEGKLLRLWVDEVRKVCTSGTDSVVRTNLDLSSLTFVDAAGEELLRDLIGRGFEVVACSSYVAELLRANPGVRLVDAE